MAPSFIINDHSTPALFIHYHLMKNAGTTIASILEREFGGAYAEVHGPYPGSALLPNEILGFARSRPELRALSSHHFRFPPIESDEFHIADCCFLRHPLDRLHSLYQFFRKTKDDSEIEG